MKRTYLALLLIRKIQIKNCVWLGFTREVLTMESVDGVLLTLFWLIVVLRFLPKKRFGRWR